MIRTMKRSLAWLLVLVICITFVPTLQLTASAATVDYKYSGSYIYNWGTRGTVATFLSPNAEKFYDDNNTSYDELSSYSGGTGTSDAPKSDLYRELKELMVSNHSKQTNYNETKNLYQYTDCQNNGGKISSFYSGKGIGPSWDGSWNREHTWPNSKGLGGQDENDIMMLRPTSTSENSSRGNTAYGKSSGYYNPNKESGGTYDLRGDVARIFLYVYVRWGNTSYAWGSSGVMESLSVLLEWMEADPVDTWELGRNDSVESITGTRNVFVDYPELAFLLFGAEIPEDLTTPSGEAASASGCDHNNFDAGVVTAPTCTKDGYTVFTCLVVGCGYSYKDNTVKATGHNYVSGACSVCGEAKAEEPTIPAPNSTITIEQAIALGSSKDHNTYTDGKYYVTGVITEVYNTTYGNMKITDSKGNILTIYGTYSKDGSIRYDAMSTKPVVGDTVTIYGSVGQYNDTPQIKNGWITAHNTTTTPEETTPPTDTPTTPPVAGDATISFANKANRTTLTTSQQVWKQNGITVTNDKAGSSSNIVDYSNPVRFYKSSDITIAYPGMIKIVIVCNTTSYAKDCQGAIGSNASVNGKEVTVTLDKAVDSFKFNASVAQIRVDSITVYAEAQSQPQECQHTNTTIIGAVAATCTTAGHTGKTVCSDCGVTVNEGSAISATGHSYTNGTCSKCGSADPTCKHTNTHVDGAIAATCTTAGHTGKTICKDCGVTINEGSAIPATQHNYANNTCVNCGAAQPVCEHGNTKVENSTSATCTATGHTGITVCQDCGMTINEGEVIPATGHTLAEWRIIKNPTCTKTGMERRDCDSCTYYETNILAALGHNDANNDFICDVCEEQLENVTTPEVPEETTPEVPEETTPEVPEETTPEETTPEVPEETTPEVPEETTPEVPEETTPEVPEETTPEVPEETTPEVPEETTPEVPEETTPEVPEETTPEEDNTPDGDNTTETQEHVCEEATGWAKFWNNIMNFFRRLFGQPELCPCGEVILEKKD